MHRAATAALQESYVEQMRNGKPPCSTLLPCAAAIAALTAAQAPAGARPTAGVRPAADARVEAGRSIPFAAQPARSPLSSRALWATVDVCNPHDQPDTIGIRGSMPGDGNAKDALYMRFRIQYLDPASRQWLYVKQGADSGLLKVGSANVARQAGRSFQFAHVAGRPPFTLRGVVTFQWKRGSTALLSTTRITGAGHKSIAGADPKGYSAAACTLP